MSDLKTARIVLCLNSGSSSRKIALFRFGQDGEELLATGAAEGIGPEGGRLWLRDGRQRLLCDGERRFPRPEAAVRDLFDEIDRQRLPRPDAIGHRFVHGGPNHLAPELITAVLTQELQRLLPFAPLHIPDEIQGVEIAASRFPGLPQVACFDTAFHRQMPETAQRFALPRTMWDDGVRRYGFHGISYEYIMQTLGSTAPDRVIIAHLGNGASMVAVRERRAVDTTMGFTPTGGFMMGTRSGDLDPGILIYLARQKNYDGSRLEQLVNHQSGLLAVSQISSDMKMLLEARTSNSDAALAVEMFCYQARKCVGALAAALSGLDLLVFTAGIGERAAPVRREICRGLEYLGIQLDDRLNDTHCDVISSPGSRCVVRVIPANEDLMIARHTYRVIFGSASK